MTRSIVTTLCVPVLLIVYHEDGKLHTLEWLPVTVPLKYCCYFYFAVQRSNVVNSLKIEYSLYILISKAELCRLIQEWMNYMIDSIFYICTLSVWSSVSCSPLKGLSLPWVAMIDACRITFPIHNSLFHMTYPPAYVSLLIYYSILFSFCPFTCTLYFTPKHIIASSVYGDLLDPNLDYAMCHPRRPLFYLLYILI